MKNSKALGLALLAVSMIQFTSCSKRLSSDTLKYSFKNEKVQKAQDAISNELKTSLNIEDINNRLVDLLQDEDHQVEMMRSQLDKPLTESIENWQIEIDELEDTRGILEEELAELELEMKEIQESLDIAEAGAGAQLIAETEEKLKAKNQDVVNKQNELNDITDQIMQKSESLGEAQTIVASGSQEGLESLHKTILEKEKNAEVTCMKNLTLELEESVTESLKLEKSSPIAIKLDLAKEGEKVVVKEIHIVNADKNEEVLRTLTSDEFEDSVKRVLAMEEAKAELKK